MHWIGLRLILPFQVTSQNNERRGGGGVYLGTSWHYGWGTNLRRLVWSVSYSAVSLSTSIEALVSSAKENVEKY